MKNKAFNRAWRLILLLLPLLLGTLPAQATEYQYNNMYFDIDVTTREATLINSGSYGTYSGTINIPETFVGAKNLTYTVTAIGASAFRNCYNLTAVSIPNTVETIGDYAFYNCSGLTELVLPNLVEDIGAYAFYGCSSLTAMALPPFVTTVKAYSFYGCSNLTSVTLPQQTLTTIESAAFYGCSKLPRVTLPQTLTTISSEAFRYCSALTTITLPKALTTIGTNAFSGSGLQTLTYANGCTTALRTYATGLLSVSLPESVVTIVDNCFYGCSQLTTITLPENLESIGSGAFQNCSNLGGELTILPSLTAIGTDAFAGTGITNLVYADGCTTALRTYATSLVTVTISNTVSRFAPDVFLGCNNLDNIIISNLEMWNHIFKSQTSNPIPVAHRIFLNGNQLTALNADFGCEVYNYAFSGCKGLKHVNITNSIPSIGAGAFMQCPDLEAVAMGSGTERIGTNAFQGCPLLSAVRLGDGLKVIGKNAFNGCSGLNSLMIGDNVQKIEEGAFQGCYKLPKAKLPATLTTIGASAFRDCYELQEAIIPAGVTTIPDYAFYDCRKMEVMEMGDAVTSIGDYAFYGCKSLKILNVPNATRTIGAYAFYNCETIRYAYLGTGITNIGNYAFGNNYYLVGFYCRTVSVPTCSTNAFSGSDTQYMILYVPDESLSAYSNKSPWSSFGTKTGLASAPVFVNSITLSAPVLIMEEQDMSQITATVAPQDATNKNVNWASSNTEVVFVNKSGSVMANEEGVATITCTAADDNGATAKSLVIVANNFKAVTGLTLSSTSLTLFEGKEAHLSATTTPDNATYSDVTWTSSNPLVAQVSEVGLVTALTPGTVTITCAAADGKGAEATCTVKVKDAVDPTIGDANEDGNVSVGDLTYVVSVILDRIEQGEDISLYDVDGDGEITIDDAVAIADIILGNDRQPSVHFLEIPTTLTIGIGETTRLSRTVIPYKLEANLTWSSSDENVVTVTSDGTITAVHAGTATVMLAEEGGLSAECVVTVDASYGSTDGHSWVDLGLPSGTHWATVNLGALSPQEYGGYYAWGETSEKTNYTWGTYEHCNGSATALTKYCTSPNYGMRDDKTVLEPADDAASAAWGNNWRMPSEEQLAELFDSRFTTSVWTEQNGLYGRLVTSRQNGNSVFLPAAGYMNGSSLSSGGSGGYYATRDLSSSDCDYNRSLSLGSSGASATDTYRYYGQSVRPVSASYVQMSQTSLNLQVGATVTLTATVITPSGTSNQITWSSSNKSVATVSSKGVVKGISDGEATIYATVNEQLVGYCKVSITNDKYITVNGVSFKMVKVSGGTFQMGATSEQGSDAYDAEKPVHSVTLSDYYIGETEVTQALWYAVMGYKPTSGGSQWSSYYGLGDEFPAYYVSWNDCQTFITKLNELTGMNFRLPTEAEWEFAARGGNASQGYKYAGSNTIGDVAWYTSNSSSKTHPVATKAPNELGLYDMSGNVWEWCQDWYGSSYYSSSPQTNPTGPSSGSGRVRRGGSWDDYARCCRVSNRDGSNPSGRFNYHGLRLAY